MNEGLASKLVDARPAAELDRAREPARPSGASHAEPDKVATGGIATMLRPW